MVGFPPDLKLCNSEQKQRKKCCMKKIVTSSSTLIPHMLNALLVSNLVTSWNSRLQPRWWHFWSFHPPFGCDPLALGKEIRIYISYQPADGF